MAVLERPAMQQPAGIPGEAAFIVAKLCRGERSFRSIDGAAWDDLS